MEIEKYSLTITDKDDSTTSVSIMPKEGLALQKERRKLYVITNEKKEFLYVGEASTSILKRFQRGTVAYNHFVRNGNARNGYKGYKWLNNKENLFRTLTVFALVFDEEKNENRKFVEAVEGELVYLIREKSGKWPLFQNEIHFSNCDGALEVALEVLENVF
ncbi:hypothetical protein FLGE108171_02180 [Flavobacterium gelidilacus]|jgi:hypothetical protein|uniref:hypothetical protein n=1 Tax=Flavobacterium gelidilacus TaxID=206041 RepID=UPI0004212823|nr:hypothetical protein [Flavobacterium gelidilacus]